MNNEQQYRANVVVHNLKAAARGLNKHTSRPQALLDTMYMSIIINDIYSYSQVIIQQFIQH